jgi:ABC-type sugar transport system substrate-binding protein
MRVALLTPLVWSAKNFYTLLADVTSAAARQLDIDLEVVEATADPKLMVEHGKELAARAKRPDYVLLANHMGVASELLPVFAEANLGVLCVIEGVGAGDRLAIGPRGCSTYLGEIVPDDVEAGRQLSEVLVAEARRRRLAGADRQFHMGILCGRQTQVNSQRFLGWKTFKDTAPDVVQSAFRYAGNDEGGETAAAMLLRSSPDTNVLWCFNDAIALGALSAAVSMGRKPGVDLIVGGFDLLERALVAISEGAMHASVGGHVIDGARGLLLLDDHHATRDLKARTWKTRLEVVKASDAERYRRFMQERSWGGANFTRFSARRTRGTPEELSLRALVNG